METRGAGGRTGEWADTGIPLWWAHRKHGSNLWYENGWCYLFLSKGHGECRKQALGFYTAAWFVTSLTAAGLYRLCRSTSSGGQQAAGTDKIRSGAPNAKFWLHRPAARTASGCKSPAGGGLSCFASASEDQPSPVCSMPCGFLQPPCLSAWVCVTLMTPLTWLVYYSLPS